MIGAAASALPSHGRGRRFDSYITHDLRETTQVMFGAIAQLVAHLHGMERVRGSNPLSSTVKRTADGGPFSFPARQCLCRPLLASAGCGGARVRWSICHAASFCPFFVSRGRRLRFGLAQLGSGSLEFRRSVIMRHSGGCSLVLVGCHAACFSSVLSPRDNSQRSAWSFVGGPSTAFGDYEVSEGYGLVVRLANK